MSTSRSVLVIGGNRFPFHRFETNAGFIDDAIPDRIDVTLSTEKRALEELAEYDAVVDYLTDSTLTAAQRDGLLSFVDSGGGYLGLHSAADLTSTGSEDPDTLIDAREEPLPELRELLGGHFLTHPEPTAYDVRIVDHYHPVTATATAFRVVDEPYVLDVDDDVRVLARMDHPECADMPVAWTNEYGNGRVFYTSLGHDEASLTNPAVSGLIENAVRWVTRRRADHSVPQRVPFTHRVAHQQYGHPSA